MTTSYKYQRGFSLMEMLVMMTMICIVAASVMPVFWNVIDRQRAAGCMQNMRNIMAAEVLYSADHDDWLVPYQIKAEGGDIFNWPDLLAPYGAPGGAFDFEYNRWIQCPAQKRKDAYGNTISGIGPIFTAGGHLHTLHTGWLPDSEGNISAKRGGIEKPAITPSWADVSGGTSVGYPALCRGCYPTGVDYDDPTLRIEEPNNFGTRHKGTTHIGFVDGHIELVPLATLQEVPVKGGKDFFRHYDKWHH